jgi:hypothetical protein
LNQCRLFIAIFNGPAFTETSNFGAQSLAATSSDARRCSSRTFALYSDGSAHFCGAVSLDDDLVVAGASHITGQISVNVIADDGSALLVHATALGNYTGSVVVAQTVDTSINGASFYLLRALTDSAGTPLEMFSVRGDGCSTVSMDAANEAALMVHAMASDFGGSDATVLLAQTSSNSSTDFYLFRAVTDANNLGGDSIFTVRGDGLTTVNRGGLMVVLILSLPALSL